MKISSTFDKLPLVRNGEINQRVETLNPRVFGPWFEELKKRVPMKCGLETSVSLQFGYLAGAMSTDAARSPHDILRIPPFLAGTSSIVNRSTGAESFSDFIGTLATS